MNKRTLFPVNWPWWQYLFCRLRHDVETKATCWNPDGKFIHQRCRACERRYWWHAR